MIKLIYFGNLKQELGATSEELPWNGGTTTDLLNLLKSRGDIWQNALSADKIFRIVVDKVIHTEEVEIKDGAEVALLPPVTGG